MRIAKGHETKEIFENNLQLLTPWLRESVGKITEQEWRKKIEITYNEEGQPICWYHKGAKRFQVTGEHPVQEAERWYQTVSIQGTGVILLFGSGFGYSLFEVFQNKPAHTLVVVFEQDLCLFTAMLHYFDLEPILSTQKIALLVGDPSHFATAFEQLFFSTVFVSCTVPTIAFTYSAQRNFKAEYLSLYRYVMEQLSLLVFYIGNDHQDNLIGFCNQIANAKEILRSPSISCLRDAYQNVPAFIVANGPSLDQNIQQLKEIQGRGLIISLESTILPLLKHDIKPDILTVIERTANTYEFHFKDRDYPDDIALISLALADRRVFPSFHGEKIAIFRDREVINQWINQCLGDGTAIDAGANVSHLALELAAYLGANPIIFVGQDFAYGKDQKTHSRDSIYSEQAGEVFKKRIQNRPLVYVEGIDGSQLASNQLWLDFRLGLERKIAVHSDRLFLDATEGGAKIQGTQCITLQEAIRQFCKQPLPRRVQETIAEHRETKSYAMKKEKLHKMMDSLVSVSAQFRKLVGETIQGKMDCQRMIQLSQKGDCMQHVSTLEKAYLKNLKELNGFMKSGIFRSFCQQAIFVHYYLMNRLGNLDTPEKITKIFQIQHKLFSHLNVICQSVSVHMENAIDWLENVEQALDCEQAEEGGNHG